MYSLRLLGGVLLEGPSGPLSGRAAQRRQLAFLALLACARDKGLTRDKLIGYLWPETDGERARRHLSDALYVLRRSLGEEAVVAAGESLRLDPSGVRCDVCEFEDALERGDLEAAVALYDGPLLDGFYLGDGREFEGWVEAERARLADRYAGAVEALAELSTEAGEHRAAAEWWKRLAAHDPYNSRAMVRLVEALAAAGDPANALELARVHEIRLREEMGIELPADLAGAIERLKREPIARQAATEGEQGAPQRTEAPRPVEVKEKAAATPEPWRLQRLVSEIHRRTLWQVLLVYAGASWAVFAVVQTLTEGLGLPGWFPAFALVFLLIGLPFVLATAFVQKGGPLSRRGEGTPIPESSHPQSTLAATTGLRRLFTWRNAISGAVVGLALWGLVAAGWLLSRASPSEDPTALAAPTAANRIVVLPFSYRGDPEYAYLGGGMVDLLSRTLDGAGELRTVNPRAVFGMLSQIEDTDGLDQARAITQRLNAERHVLGEIVEVGGRLRMNARLSDPARDGEYVEATIEGPADSLYVLIDNLTVQLLVGSEGERATRLISVASATTDSLEALKAFLEGERHFHRAWGRGDAFSAFRRAVEIDSTFALAWFRYSQLAYMSGMSLVEHGRAADMAAKYADRLPPRERRMLEAYRAYVRGAAAESERIYREILRVYPDDVEAWFGLSLLLAEYAEIHGRPRRSAVRQPAERVLHYQPEHSQALWYIAMSEASEGRWAQTDSVFQRMYGDSIPWNFTAITVYGSGDREGQDTIRNKIKPYGPHWLLFTAWWVAGFGENPGGALQFSRLAEQHTEAPRWAALNHLFSASFELSLGRWRAAQEEFERQSAHNAAWAIEDAAYWSLAPYLSVSPSELRAWRDSIARWDAEAVPPAVEPIPFWANFTDRHEDVHPHLRLYLLGRLNARLGDGEAALRYAADLDAMETPGIPGTLSRDLAQSIRAHVLFYEGQTAGALRALEAAPREVGWGRHQGSWFFTGLQDKYLRAQLLEELERYEEALRWYQSISYWPFPVMAGPAHLGQARVYERLGNREMGEFVDGFDALARIGKAVSFFGKAAEQYARFIDLWKDADPELQPQVEAARRALAALPREM